MSSSVLLSRQNVERWLPEAGFSKSAGFVARLFSNVHRAMGTLTSVKLPSAKNEMQQKAQNELERFFLWGQGLSIMDGDLDEVLAHSKELREQVLTLLLRLGTAVLQCLLRTSDNSAKGVGEQFDDLRTLLNAAETILLDADSTSESGDLDTFSESDTSDYGATEIMDEISIYVDCLLDLSSALDNPALDVQPEGSRKDNAAQLGQEQFDVSSEEALIYCRRIRDRFENLPKYLVERLAEANVLRAAALRVLRAQPAKPERPLADDITESLFSNTESRLQTDTTKSSVPPSVFSSSAKRRPSLPEVPDDISDNGTFATFATAASAIALGRARVPPMPEIKGDGYDCSVCSIHLIGVNSRRDWKKHVFKDLMPYVCTAEECDEASKRLYTHSRIWAMHDAAHDEALQSPAQCAFCGAEYSAKGDAYYKHISKHLREISLAVLPQAVDDEGGDEGNDESDMDSQPDESPGTAVVEEENDLGNPTKDLDTEVSRLITGAQRLDPGNIASPPASASSERGESPSRQDYDPDSGSVTRVDSGNDGKDGEPESAVVASSSSNKDASTGSEAAGVSAPGDAKAPATDDDVVDLDSVIDRLLEVRGSRPGKMVQLLEMEIRWLCLRAKEIFISQPILLELGTPVKVCGNIHGQYYDLLRLFEFQGFPPEANYLFLGNYVDVGKQSLETICLMLAYKIKYPENFFLLRGNHEIASTNKIYGFHDEMKRRYDIKLWRAFTDVFDCMPLAAIIDEKIFCMNGGLSPDLNSMEQIRRVRRPTDIPEFGLMSDLLWADPDKDITGWSENDQGNSFTFGADVVDRFLKQHDMDLIVRSKQVVEDGYEFFAKRQLVTLFSAPNYAGQRDNAGAVMCIDENLIISFQILKPGERKQRFGRR